MKSKKGLLQLFGVIGLAALISISLVVGCAAPAPAPAPTVTVTAPAPAPEELPQLDLVFASFQPAGTAGYEFAEKGTISKVEELVPRVKFTMYPGSTLVGVKDMYRALQDRVIDFGWTWSPAIPGAFPVSEVFTLPGLMTEDMVTNFMVEKELFNKYPAFEEQFSPKVKNISTFTNLRADIHALAPIKSLADLKGKVIGAHNALAAEALTLNGASASLMMNPDMYTAGERGVVDAVVCPWGAFGSFSLYEVYHYHTLLGVSPGVTSWMWNRDTWDKFTPEEQQKLELLDLWLQQRTTETTRMLTEDMLTDKVTPEKGHEIIAWTKEELEQFTENSRPTWDKWIEEMEAMGVPGEEIIEDILFLVKTYDYS